MLAGSAPDAAAAIERLGTAAAEWKLDGIRVQIHARDGEVSIFTRSLDDITDRLPELVEIVRALPVRSVILDGEAIALGPDDRPLPFQVTASHASRRTATNALSLRLFDCLHLDGEDLIDHPASERVAALASRVPAVLCVPRVLVHDAAGAEAALAAALEAGHEGLVLKALDAPYEAGRRGGTWLKVKPRHTLDLVVLAVEWGSGRRQGLLSNLHLGARDPAGGFVMLGKTFKGMTDELLRWQTEQLLALRGLAQRPRRARAARARRRDRVRRRADEHAATPAASRSASPASSATGRTSGRRRRTRSTPCASSPRWRSRRSWRAPRPPSAPGRPRCRPGTRRRPRR